MLTGYEDPDTESSALAAGAIDYLSKDALSARLLAQSIRYAITIKQTQTLLQEKIEELKTTQARILQTEKLSALGTLVAGIAHELNNPLMGLLNYVEYAQRRADDARVADTLGKAVRELHRIQRVINNMLTFARPSEEGIGQVDVGEALQRTLELMATDLRHQGIQLVVDLPPALPPVCANLDGLQQVFLNLLTNARDAVAASREKIITIAAYRDGAHVCVQVRDTGLGIPAPIEARIFDPFFTTKPPGKGTGLGLSVSRNILLGFGALLTHDSQAGQGVTFTLTLRADASPYHNEAGNKAWPS
jgi:C4-dicarboxylate-specific signal transduction histidine kinase